MIKIYEGMNFPDFSERSGEDMNVDAIVEEIISTVKLDGDKAVKAYCDKFDGESDKPLQVSDEEIEAAFKQVGEAYVAILEEAAENISAYHKKQRRNGFVMDEQPGIVMGQKITALDKVGVYVPGGTASYPSTVLMDTIPAKIAGVGEIIMTTPAKDGVIAPEILAAAKIAGADKIFRVGGAQAVAALAYGTESIPRVDKIVGPGNIFVATAKRMVFGRVDIDMIAGPSEILVIADEGSNPAWVAADMLSQAEHDKLASSVLVTPSRELGEKVAKELEIQLSQLPREEIARSSVENFGAIIIVENLQQAVEVSNKIAPEHLELCVEQPFALLSAVRHAGSIFMGRYSCEPLGDYFAGPNHTLPTNGTARFSSALSVDDFIKKSSFLFYDGEALQRVGRKVATFAKSEGLDAHARAVEIRLEGDCK